MAEFNQHWLRATSNGWEQPAMAESNQHWLTATSNLPAPLAERPNGIRLKRKSRKAMIENNQQWLRSTSKGWVQPAMAESNQQSPSSPYWTSEWDTPGREQQDSNDWEQPAMVESNQQWLSSSSKGWVQPTRAEFNQQWLKATSNLTAPLAEHPNGIRLEGNNRIAMIENNQQWLRAISDGWK